MKQTKVIKLMIINNFIDHWTSNEAERERMKNTAAVYVTEDHVDEIAQSNLLDSIVVNKDAAKERVEKTYNEVLAKIKSMAKNGLSTFRIDLLVADSIELEEIVNKLESEHQIMIGYKGKMYNGYERDLKSWTIRFFTN